MNQDFIISVIEMLGTFAFAVSGIRHAAAKQFDWFGGYVCGIAVALGHLGRGGASVMSNPYIQRPLYTAEPHHVVAGAVGVDDGQRTYVAVGGSTSHGVAADGCKGSYLVGNPVHGVIGEHAAHGES